MAPPDPDTSTPAPLVQAVFYHDDLGGFLQSASEDTLNRAAFGIIQVDRRGRVTFYNRFESRFSGRSPDETIGRDFFDEVAPCTRSRFFRGRFEQGLAAGRLDVIFSYTLTYRLRPTLVEVRLIVQEPKTAWILIRPKAGAAA